MVFGSSPSFVKPSFPHIPTPKPYLSPFYVSEIENKMQCVLDRTIFKYIFRYHVNFSRRP